jgi:group II intron reverse transcriptase/maturase
VETTDFQETTETKLKRIAWLSASDEQKVFNNLMHLVNEESLAANFNALDRRKAVGIDGIDKEKYGSQLTANLKLLVNKLKSMSYRPGNLRRVLIPKEGKPGAIRPLGISNFEDKLFQKVMQNILESIYEPLFLECSYGFRPGRGCHDAVRKLRQYTLDNNVETIMDIDLTNYFESIDHKLLLNVLQEKIGDKRFIRYIARMLKAGILSKGELILADEGTAQGSIASPILSNIFAHHVIDKWFEDTVKPHCRGKVELFRYCDDAVICCQYISDALRVKKALAGRLEKYKLNLSEEKTKMVSFSRDGYAQGGKQESFDFLGFTFYWGKSRNNKPLPKVKSSGKRMRGKLKSVNGWARAVRNKYRLHEVWKRFCIKLEGHIRYYGVSFNMRGIKCFVHRAIRILFKWLNRRSQKRSFTWEKFEQFRQEFPPPKIKIWHTLF